MNRRPKHIVIDGRIRRSSTGRYADRLIEHLQDIDKYHRYTILVQPDDDWQMHSPNFKTVVCPYPQFSFNPVTELRFAFQLYKLRPSLVHFTMTQQPLLYFGKIITTTHDLTMLSFIRRGDTRPSVYWLKDHLYRFLMWYAHHKSKRIITPTKTVAKEVANYQPFTAHKLIVTYEASEPPLEVAAEQPAAVNGDFLLYVGTAFPHKNLGKAVEALEILAEQYPKLQLVLTGKTEKHYRELAERTAKTSVAKKVIFTGFVSDASLKWLFTNCKAYVFPSLSEGFGLPALEAMTYGAPVVASDASCIPEVCGDGAYYFNARDPKDIVKKVSDVLKKQSLRKQLVAKGYKQIKKYSWSHTAQETLIAYKRVLAD